MSKYSVNFKTKVVHYHMSTPGGARKTAIHFGIDHATVRKWHSAYQLHGPLAFSNHSQTYTVDDKLNVIRRTNEEHWSSRQASAFFNIATPSTVQTWLKRYNEGGADALIDRRRGNAMPKPKKPTPPLDKPGAEMTPEEMQKELEYLRAENAYLKKLDALIQEKRSASKKKH
jgi:transposase